MKDNLLNQVHILAKYSKTDLIEVFKEDAKIEKIIEIFTRVGKLYNESTFI